MLSWSDLSTKQQDKISNGCGSKGLAVAVPDFMFTASCNQHDFYYWRGGNDNDRKWADEEFYRLMKDDARTQSNNFFQEKFYLFWAFIYYRSVRLGRLIDKTPTKNKFWNYGKMKTKKDIL